MPVPWCGDFFYSLNVTVHPAEGRRGAPLPKIGCNGLLGVIG